MDLRFSEIAGDLGENVVAALEAIERGGWPMVPLAACSVIALAVVLERLVALRRRTVLHPEILRATETFQGDEAEKLAALCAARKGPLARILHEILRHRSQGHAPMVDAMNAAGRLEMGRLERGLVWLEIVAGVAPLIGLLGTVLGMLDVFDAITAQGIGDAQVLSGGISKALMTTIAGLCVGIPALAFHGWLSKRAESLATELQHYATQVVMRIQALSDHATP